MSSGERLRNVTRAEGLNAIQIEAVNWDRFSGQEVEMLIGHYCMLENMCVYHYALRFSQPKVLSSGVMLWRSTLFRMLGICRRRQDFASVSEIFALR